MKGAKIIAPPGNFIFDDQYALKQIANTVRRDRGLVFRVVFGRFCRRIRRR